MMMRIFFFLLAAISLSACNTTTCVLIGTKRAPVSPSAIKLYTQPPKKFEQIAILDADSVYTFRLTQQGAMDAVMERIRNKAAALGANAILLNNVGSESAAPIALPSFGTATVTTIGNTSTVNYTGSPSTFTSPLKINYARALAIFVLEE